MLTCIDPIVKFRICLNCPEEELVIQSFLAREKLWLQREVQRNVVCKKERIWNISMLKIQCGINMQPYDNKPACDREILLRELQNMVLSCEMLRLFVKITNKQRTGIGKRLSLRSYNNLNLDYFEQLVHIHTFGIAVPVGAFLPPLWPLPSVAF